MSYTRRMFLHHGSALGLASLWGLGCGEGDGPDMPMAGMGPPGQDPATVEPPWWLEGNYAPVTDEIRAESLEVEGQLPEGLTGLYVRNGPNPSSDSDHWFFGDGMLHGVWFENGRALRYQNRWVQTRQLAGESSVAPVPEINPSNTNLVAHGGKLLSLYEMGFPHSIDPKDLTTFEVFDYGGTLPGAMTAHPKVDPVSGELFGFGYHYVSPYLRYYHVDANGELMRVEEIDIPASTMQHDFQLTQNRVLFFDLPLVLNLREAATGGVPYEWQPDNGTRIGIMPRSGGNADVQWFDIDPGYIFHSFNARDDGDSVVMDTVRHEHMWLQDEQGNDVPSRPIPYRYRFDLRTGQVQEGPIHERLVEFPVIDHRQQGGAHRYGYALKLRAEEEAARGEPFGLYKLDFQNDDLIPYTFGEGLRPDEHIFVPAGPDAGEDEGWLMGYTYDENRDRSMVTVLDARDIQRGPVAKVHLPRRVPHGFHGQWVGRKG